MAALTQAVSGLGGKKDDTTLTAFGQGSLDFAAGAATGIAKNLAKEAEADFAASQKEIEADRIDRYGAEIMRAGNEQEALYSEKALKMSGASKAAIARKSISLGSGLAKAIQAENARVSDTDLLTMKNRVSRAVLNNSFKARNLRLQAKFDRDAASGAVWKGLATAGAKAASGYASTKIRQAMTQKISR